MIKRFVNKFMAAKPAIEAELRASHPDDYDALVRSVIRTMTPDVGSYDDTPDPDRITTIDHGDYQGTRLYVIGAMGYQPRAYWAIFVNYGSCSGCDTFEAIKDYSDKPPSDEQVNSYWTLMLHMAQSMRSIEEPDADDAVGQ